MSAAATDKAGILIPTYNRVGLLAESLGSALAQSHPRIEIIVIDNGSGDGTAAYMNTVRDGRVMYVANDRDIGLTGSINKGMGLFSDDVEWCTVLADDDLLDRDFIDRALGGAAARGARSVVDGHRVFVDGSGKVLRDAMHSPDSASAAGYLRSRMLFSRETYLTGVLFSRRAFREINGYPGFSTGACSDDAFIFSLSARDRLYHLDDAISYVRIHGDAESRRASDALKHVRSVDEYRRHISAMLRNREMFPEETCRFASRLLRFFATNLGDMFWTIRANDLFPAGGGKSPSRVDVEELVSSVRKREFPYTYRVRTNAWAIENIGVNLESYLPFRAFFTAIKGFKLYYYKWLHSALHSGCWR